MARLIFGSLICGPLLVIPAAAQMPPGFEVLQITDNPYFDYFPEMNNCGQIVFARRPDGNAFLQEEIFLYDDATGETIQLTNDNVRDFSPDINDEGVITWARGLGPPNPNTGLPTLEIALYDTNSGVLTRLTDNDVDDNNPSINNTGRVVWKRILGYTCGLISDIYMYDGQSIFPITTDAIPDSVSNQGPAINDLGHVAWTRYDFCAGRPNWDSSIRLYRDGVTIQVSPPTSSQPQFASLNNRGQVTWDSQFPSGYGIELWDNGVVSQFADHALAAVINDRLDMFFLHVLANGDTRPWFHRAGSFYEIPGGDPFWNGVGDVNQQGEVAWQSTNYPHSNIWYMRRLPLGDLNCDGAVNGADIDPFFLALGAPTVYQAAFPDCDRTLGDVNGDGAVNGADIDPFFELLAP